MQHQTDINSDHNDALQQQQQHLHKRSQDQEQEEQEHLSSLLLMQTRRRQKTLSSISNFVPLHILLNQPRGVSFSLTVPKSFTIEQLARQIEAEYAYLVEREVGYSRFPVIECGALFDHVELPRRRRRAGGKKADDISNIRTSGSRKPSQDYREDDDEEYENDDEEDEENEDDHAGESVVDERDEAESRGVQLRFSDRVEDVLERDSTVHVVNIDQGLARGRKASLTNLAAMAVSSSISQGNLHHPIDSAGPNSPPPSSSMSHLGPHISSNSLSLLQLPHNHSQQPLQQGPQRLSSPISFGPESDVLSVHSSVLATAASTPFQSPLSPSDGSGGGSDVRTGGAHEFSPNLTSIQQQSGRYQSTSREGTTPSASNSKGGGVTAATTTETSTSTQIDVSTKDSLLASPYVSSNSLSSSSFLLGADLSPQAATINTTAATMTDGGAPTPTAATTPTTIATTNSSTTFSSSSSSSFRPRSRATDLLLNLEASSNDARFQEILHNTIALDLFRQFCFQEYSIENLLFWMDVEVFAKPNLEMQRADRLKHKILQKRLEKQQRAYRQQQQQRGRSRTDSKEGPLDEKQQNMQGEGGGLDEKENLEVTEEEIKKLKLEVEEEDAQFAVQHARYIYLTYIDTYAPLQVNLSDESRTDIPWPILDANDNNSSSNKNHSRNNSGASKDGKKGSRSRIGSSSGSRTEEVIGWPLDRHMFDGAQEHTYQLMKGHTLVRFEDCELWKSAQRMMHEQPNEYEKATVHGPLNSHYCPDTSVILSTVARSRSRHPTAKLQTLYNWNNSTTDLDRSRDKEEALAKTMSQYFGPIPQSIRHPGRVILGLGPRRHGGAGVGSGFDDDDYDEDEDEFDDFDTFEEHVHGVSGPLPMTANTATTMMSESKRSSTSSNGGFGGGFRKNRFTKRLSGRGKGGNGQHHSNASDDLVSGDLYEDSYSMDHHDPSHDGIDSVANGRRTTRWMVAGYFNDQVRLTAAQRKRLLRRNNKLTKFFGSRVDGTLRPVEETEDGGFVVPPSSRSSAAGGVGSLAALGTSGVPMLGSPLAYALSSSTIHDMDRKGRPKKNKSKRDSGNGHEVLFHFPGASKSASGSRSMNLLQKFKRNSGEYYDSSSSTSSNVRSSLFLNTNRKSLDEFGLGSSTSNNTRHFRSATSVDLPPGGRRILAAHPHPLWSGSLSDHEVDSPSAYERRRQLSILSIMGNGLYNSSTSPKSPHATGLTPTTPTELYASPRGMDQDGGATNKPAHTTGGGSSDRQAMSSRRKKADKLSTFFGAQLTPQELSSQLRMEDDSDLVSSTTSQSTAQRQDKNKNDQQQQPVQRSSSESDKHKSKASVTEPSILSVNHLSHRDRTLLWKRSKKLRGILGESLQESEVALSLTIPVLLGSSTRLRNSMSSPRRASTGSPSIKKKRLTGVTCSSSLHGKHASNETQTGDEEVEGEDDSEEYEDLNSSSNLVRPKVAKSSSKTRARRSSNAAAPASVRARRSSIASTTSSVYRRQSHQHGRSGRAGSIPGLNRAISMQSLDSFQSIDTMLDEGDLDDDLRGTEEELGIPRYSHRRRTSSIRPHGYSHLSPRYRQIHATAGLASACGDGTITATGAAAAAERINRKKKMDKIQQFLGDRVPEQDLWMGTVGREKTKEMMEKNLLSSVNNVQQDGVSVAGAGGGSAVTTGSVGAGLSRSATGSKMTPRFKRASFPSRSKSTYTNAPKSDDCPSVNEKEKSGDNSISSASTKKSKLRPVVVTTGSRAAGGIRMERSLSDPPRLEDGAGNGLGIRSPGVHQPPYQWHTTVSRLRQQLALPDTITASASVTSPTVSRPTSFSSSFAASPRLSSSSNTNPGHPTITTKTIVAPTSASAPATAGASTSPNSPNNLSPGFMTVLYDEEGEDYSAAEGGEGAVDDESAQILPRLRAMSGKDQERFLKRAEKLERMFGHFPPSALLHSSLTTASSSSSGTTESTATAADGVEREGRCGASRSGEGEEMVYASTSTRGGETSMFQLAAFLASATSTQDTNPSSSSSVTSPTTSTSPMTPTSTKKKSEEGKKWISETMDALAEVEWAATRRASATSGEGVVESLVIAPV